MELLQKALILKPHVVPGATLEWKRRAFLPQVSWL